MDDEEQKKLLADFTASLEALSESDRAIITRIRMLGENLETALTGLKAEIVRGNAATTSGLQQIDAGRSAVRYFRDLERHVDELEKAVAGLSELALAAASRTGVPALHEILTANPARLRSIVESRRADAEEAERMLAALPQKLGR